MFRGGRGSGVGAVPCLVMSGTFACCGGRVKILTVSLRVTDGATIFTSPFNSFRSMSFNVAQCAKSLMILIGLV